MLSCGENSCLGSENQKKKVVDNNSKLCTTVWLRLSKFGEHTEPKNK